jgi:hypothetical protein
MRKVFIAVGAIAALAIPTAGIAAELHSPHVGSFCPKSAGQVQWHFVNNQTEGASGGTIVVTFDYNNDGDSLDTVNNQPETQTDAAAKVLKNVLHFNIYTTNLDARLLGASTGAVPGKLVLSDSCKK